MTETPNAEQPKRAEFPASPQPGPGKPDMPPLPVASTPVFSAPSAWRIDGIDPKVQGRAAQAAAESNLPLADWLAKAIEAAIGGNRPASRVPAVLGGFAAGVVVAGAAAMAILLQSVDTPVRPPIAAVPPSVPQVSSAAPAPAVAQQPIASASPVQESPAPTPAPAPAPVQGAAPAPATGPAAPQPTPQAEAPVSTPAPQPTYTTAAPPLPPPQPEIDPSDPLAELKRAALGGDAAAQFTLGARHAAGDGAPQSWEEALKWFTLAAERGMATAQHNLAVMYERSRGTDQNLEAAAKWYEKAAEQGYPPSQYNLAVAYARGWGVKADVDKAIQWFERAAERIPQANIALAEIFEGGMGVGRDLGRARSHYQLAATAGDQRAQAKLRQLTPDAVQREMTKDIQTLLGKLRYNAGTPDGRVGQRTVAAIREFQRSAGVPDDGKPTQELLELLRSVARE